MKRVVVIGGGLAGLAAAIRLSRHGYRVTIIEKNRNAGGKTDFLRLGRYLFDTGPTLLTMPFILEDLFNSAGVSMRDNIEPVELDPACRYTFADGSILNAYSDPDRMEDEIGRFSPSDSGAFTAFMKHAKRIYEAAAQPFLFSGFGSWSLPDIARLLKYLPAVVKLDAGRSLSESVAAHFRDERLRQLFNRFATYNGSSPYLAPATLAIIPYVEFAFGGWYVKGGLRHIVDRLLVVAQALGAGFQAGTAAEQILVAGGHVKGVRLEDGRVLECEIVVSNADPAWTLKNLLDETRSVNHARFDGVDLSLAGVMLYIGVKRRYDLLTQHNIFFSADYRKEFDAMVGKATPADEPTLYVCASCVRDHDHAPEGCMNLFVLANAPAWNGKFDWQGFKNGYREIILNRLRKSGLHGLSNSIEVEEMTTPDEFERKYNAPGGAIYGTSSNSRWSAFRRPPNRSRDVRGLYFAGGGAHPGGGIPLVLLSGSHAAELVRKDYA